MKRTFLLESSFALAIATTSIACGSSTDAAPRSASAASMETSLDALGVALKGCLRQRDSCEANLADATVDPRCEDAFATCKKDTLDRAMPEVARSAEACSQAARECRADAVDDGAEAACRETLSTCIEARHDKDAGNDEKKPGDAHGKADAGTGHGGEHPDRDEPGSPVKACTDALHVCIEGDEPTKSCTDRLRSCIDATLAERGQERAARPDAGKSETAHGKDERLHDDAGDQAAADADAGVEVVRGKPERSERDASHGKPHP